MANICFARIHELPEGAERFFKIFTRFEFALKECKYLPTEGRARPCWNDFAKDLGSEFFEEMEASGQVETLLKTPPKKQVSRGKVLNFDPVPAPKNPQQLLEAVRRVRNNLLHGGKSEHPDADPNDPKRNNKLVAEAQWVLEQALLKHHEVRSYFEGKY